KVFFGIGFFVATVFLVLQLLPVGSAIMADRYVYIPSIGIFYLAGEAISRWLWRRRTEGAAWKYATAGLLAVAVILFSASTYARCQVWKDGMTLWNDVLAKENTAAVAYNNRGLLWMEQNRNKEALDDYTQAIHFAVVAPDPITFNNRAN